MFVPQLAASECHCLMSGKSDQKDRTFYMQHKNKLCEKQSNLTSPYSLLLITFPKFRTQIFLGNSEEW